MNNYLQTYKISLHTIGPVFVGSGKSIDKKEYIFLKNKGKVLIPDQNKMFLGLQKMHKDRQFVQYIMSGNDDKTGLNRMDLSRWLRENDISPAAYREWIRYELDCGDFLQQKGAIQIMEFQKDGLGSPYVPGSSIKGMLRTILLAYELSTNEALGNRLRRNIFDAIDKGKGRTVLNPEIRNLEVDAFHVLGRRDARGEETRKQDAINDILSGLIISDSEPISLSDMTLCQKIDENTEGKQKPLNMLRECVKPGKEIRFELTIDSKICHYDIETIQKAIENFSKLYYNMFLSYYCDVKRPSANTVWLGGGTGFMTKTVVYPLLGKVRGVDATVGIFEKTLSPQAQKEHKHYKDKRLGVSPHMIKVTKYDGKRYQFGECQLIV